jgi:hypothetical protein
LYQVIELDFEARICDSIWKIAKTGQLPAGTRVQVSTIRRKFKYSTNSTDFSNIKIFSLQVNKQTWRGCVKSIFFFSSNFMLFEFYTLFQCKFDTALLIRKFISSLKQLERNQATKNTTLTWKRIGFPWLKNFFFFYSLLN